IKGGNKVIFLKGICGTGKSAIALNLARKFGKTSIVVPIKSLQEQYLNDYTNNKHVLKTKKFKVNDFPEFSKYPGLKEELEKGEKLKISSIVGRKNFKCNYLQENKEENYNEKIIKKETNSNLFEIFEKRPVYKFKKENDLSCDNDMLPCKIEIKEKNIRIIKEYIKKNPKVKLSDFSSIEDIKRMTIAMICPYWSPILSDRLPKIHDALKISYMGLNDKKFNFFQRKPGCPYYDQYMSYKNSDVLIYNSLKYKLETLMDRKPMSQIDIIDECDEFLDSFAVEESINLNKLTYAIDIISTKDEKVKELLLELSDIINTIKISKSFTDSPEGIFPAEKSIIHDLLKTIIENSDLLDLIENNESSYLFHLDEVARSFYSLIDETFFTIEKKDKNTILHLVTTNLEKRFKELLEKNKILILMSGTIHSESVIKSIFGITQYTIIDAETKHQGKLIKQKTGSEFDCSYKSFKSGIATREKFLKSLEKCIKTAKKPTLVHITAFSDLPTEVEIEKYNLTNLPTPISLIEEQRNDPLGKRVVNFKNKKTNILFTTKCSRGIDFPGDMCNSIIITRFPYPNISGIFWKILKKNKPFSFMKFYMDKAHRELLQRIYRGLRSKNDNVELLSPDSRVLKFEF
ncbi:hypothetical protein GOV12_03365, partial [Candidatus Pacearchaeota archaeon]|nr:hypothetical protein [Candidatus Pacearchaeota archaeon]